MAKDKKFPEPDKRAAEREKVIILGAIAAMAVGAAIIASLFLNPNPSTNFCSSQFTSQQKYTCLESAYVSANNSAACHSLPQQYTDNCYLEIALKTENPQLCSGISNYSSKAACITQASSSAGSYSNCYQLSEPYYDKCLYLIGTSHSSAQACSSIRNASLGDACSYSIYFSKALEQKNESYCAMIGNGTYSESSEILNSTQAQNLSSIGNIAIAAYYYSSYLNLQISPRDLCYYSLAYQSTNSSYCHGISNSSFESICSSSYSTNASENTSYYNSLSKLCRAYGTACPYTTLISAIYSKNITKCRSLNATAGAACFASIASYYSNSSYCQYINNATLNSACVESVLYSNSTNSSA